jgi:hypothetical protein
MESNNTQLMTLVTLFNNSNNSVTSAWFQARPVKRVTADEADASRLLMDGGEPAQHYRDEAEHGTVIDLDTETDHGGANGSRPRVEPSALQREGQRWRDEEEDGLIGS